MKKYLFFVLFSCLFSFSGLCQFPMILIDDSNMTSPVSKCVGDSVKLTCLDLNHYARIANWYMSTDNINYSACGQGFYLYTVISDTIKYYKAYCTTTYNYTPSVTLSKKLSPSKPIIISGDSIFCQTIDTLTYISKLDTNSTTYSWTFPSGSNIISGNTNDTIKVSSLTTGNIIIKGINSCNEIGDSLVYFINVETKAIPSPITGDDNICKGENSKIYTIDSIPGYVSMYQWTLPSGCLLNSYNKNQITVSYGTSAISGNIKVKPVNSCGVGDSSMLFITVNNAIPTPVATQIGNTLSSNATSGNQWYNSSGIINGATSQIYSPSINGSYYVIVSNTNCSSPQSNTVAFVMTSITEVEKINANVYPNPATNQLNVSIETRFIGSKFSITDYLGRIVLTGKFTTENNIIELENLSKGIYLLRIGDNGQQSIKVVKE